MMHSDRYWNALNVVWNSMTIGRSQIDAAERAQAATGIDIVLNSSGDVRDSGRYRMLQIQNTREHVTALRYAYPFEATCIMMRVHHVKHIDPLFTRAQREYMSIAAAQPELSVRETWRLAWHNVRSEQSHAGRP